MPATIETIESRLFLSAAPTTAAVPANQKANLKHLRADLKAIHGKSDVTAAQRQKLVADVKAVLAVATKPNAASVKTFRTDLVAAVADKKVTADEKAKLTADFSAILISANVSQALADAVVADVKVIVDASHVTRGDVRTIAGDLKSIVDAFKGKNA